MNELVRKIKASFKYFGVFFTLENAKYTSPEIQSQFIKMVGLAISEEIIWRVKEAGMYAIMADETPDLSETEQLAMYTCSLCLEWSGRRTPFRY